MSNGKLIYEISDNFEHTENQKILLDNLVSKNTMMTFIEGPAGTAKTYISVLASMFLLKQKQINSIVYLRSLIESADKGLGYLPGELNEKFRPLSVPLYDKMKEIIKTDQLDKFFAMGIIEALPINYLRGVTFNNKCVIVDEAQNISKKELITIITRIGENSKIFILGDSTQSDSSRCAGDFRRIADAFNKHPQSKEMGIYSLKLGTEDIVRNEKLKFIVDVLETIED